MANNVLVAPASATAYNVGTGVTAADVQAYWTANNTTIDGPASDAIHQALGLNLDLFFGSRLADAYNAPDFRVTTGTLATGAAFTNAKFSEANRTAFFEKNVTFRGAFGSTNWATGWAEFRPSWNKAY